MKNDDDLLDPESFWNAGTEEEPTEQVPVIGSVRPELREVQRAEFELPEAAGETLRSAEKVTAGAHQANATPAERRGVTSTITGATPRSTHHKPQQRRKRPGRRASIRPLVYLVLVGAVV
ncbi:MAG: hypothetical protein D6806_14595, partial [Deltaproteobacteria bacterium]